MPEMINAGQNRKDDSTLIKQIRLFSAEMILSCGFSNVGKCTWDSCSGPEADTSIRLSSFLCFL